MSGKYPASQGSCALVAPVAEHASNKNQVIVYDLRENPNELIKASVEQIRERVFTAQSALPEGIRRFPLKAIQLNKCPVLAPATMLATLSPERLQQLDLDGEQMRRHLAILRQAGPDFGQRVAAAFERDYDTKLTDPDEQIYAGGFLSPGTVGNWIARWQWSRSSLPKANSSLPTNAWPKCCFVIVLAIIRIP